MPVGTVVSPSRARRGGGVSSLGQEGSALLEDGNGSGRARAGQGRPHSVLCAPAYASAQELLCFSTGSTQHT